MNKIGSKSSFKPHIIDDLIDNIKDKELDSIVNIINAYNKENQIKIIDELFEHFSNKDREHYEWFVDNVEQPYNKLHVKRRSKNEDECDFSVGSREYISPDELNKLKDLIIKKNREKLIRKISLYKLKTQIKIIDDLFDEFKSDTKNFQWFVDKIELCHNKFVKKVKKSHKKPTEYVISLDSHIIPKIGTLANISNTIFTDLIYLVQIKDKKSLMELLNFWTRESQETVISRLYQLFSSDTNKQSWFYNNIVIPYSNLHQRQFTIEFLVKNPLLNPIIGYENPNIPNLGEYLLEAVMRKDATTIINTINRFDIDRQREILNYLTNSLSFNPQLSEWFLSHIQIPYTNLHSNVIIIGGSLDEHYKEKYINMKKKYIELKKLNK